jgi:hypothetical protein
MTLGQLAKKIQDLLDNGVLPDTVVVTPSDDYFMNFPTKLTVGYVDPPSNIAVFYDADRRRLSPDKATKTQAAVLIE